MTDTLISAEDAEEYTQSLGQIVGGSWRQIAWASRLGIPEALGLSTEDWVQQRLGGYVRLSVSERREAVKELTASLGYEPVGFSDPQRALDSLRQDPGRYDAVITDERMPGLRGTTFARALLELRPDLPVILVTGYRVAELDLEARRCGIRHILDKPLRLQELSRALSEVFHAEPESHARPAIEM